MQASTTLRFSVKTHNDEVAQLLFSPDGKTLAVHDESTITLWDTATWSLRSITEDHDDMLFGMAFSPDYKWIAAASNEGHGRIWSTVTGELKQTVSVDDERMLSLVFSADSKLIATGSEVLMLWDVDTGELQHTFLGPGDHSLSFAAVYERHEYPSEISQVLFSPDGKTLVSICSGTYTVRLWSMETRTLRQTIKGHGATFSPDGAHLAVKVDHTTIQVYGTVDWQVQSIIQNTTEQLASPTFSHDSKVIATSSGRQIMLWDTKSSEAIRTFEDSRRKVSALSFSPDGKILISGARECGLRVWDVGVGECSLVLEHENGARDRFNPRGYRLGPPAFAFLFFDGRGRVATAFPDGSVSVWDVEWG